MKKRIILTATALIVIVGVVVAVIVNRDFYYSKKLVRAIRAEDLPAIERILTAAPHCVNTYPQTRTEKFLNTIVEDRGMRWPLSEACLTHNIEIVRMLLEAGADPNCNDGYPPLSIAYLGKPDRWYPTSCLLIEYGASLDYTTESSGGKSHIISNIVSVRAGSALPGYVPENEEEVLEAFYYAMEHCDHDKVDWRWALHDSVSADRIEIVQFLLDENYCDVNDTSRGMGALQFAARDSTAEMVQLLLDRGADKTYRDCYGYTAYDYAVEKKKEDMLSLLAF